jgi:hypothetical protein
MDLKGFLNWSLFVLLTVPLGILSCQDCRDCGPSTAEPFVNFQFYNIDSLIKVEDSLVVLEDSLEKVMAGIDTGNADLDTIRAELENSIDVYEEVKNDIEEGKIKIDEVMGPNGEGPIYFTDSLTNDSLTIFRFPLDMNYDTCSFIVNINGNQDLVGVQYIREIDYASYQIVVRIFETDVTESTYDSTKVTCDKTDCTSNETTIEVYF